MDTMEAAVAKHFTSKFAHETLGNGNKRVIARVGGELKETYLNEVTVDANGTATATKYGPFYQVKRFYINISTGTTNEPNFNCIVHKLDNIKKVRQICLPENVVEIHEMRFSANARKFCVVCRIGQTTKLYQYDTFNGNGLPVNEKIVHAGESYRFDMNQMLM
jgi:hypothetical protein